MQSLSGKRDSNILFVVFIIVVLVNTETVTSFINYGDERHDEQPLDVELGEARTTRLILESSDNWKTLKSRYTLQEATEHLLQYGALLRNQILDTFGALVYDHYDDYSIGQTEALYKVYHETLERKYNIFNIVPSVLANPDTRPTIICRHIHKHVHTCLKESSQLCTTIKKHDDPHPHAAFTSAVNVTRRVYKSARLRKHYPRGFSLPAVLEYLKAGILKFTVGLLSGLLHNVQYDSFDDEIRTAEKHVMVILSSEMKGVNEHQALMRRDQVRRAHTVSELLKQFFESRKTIYNDKKNKYFAVLAEHVVREVEAISQNIELFGSIYENDTIHMRFLFDLVLPPDVVDSDITEAKNYLLQKMDDYNIVRKYLKVEKYQQSGPDQLLMEILGQMRDINFAVDIATALHTHARFWHQSHMVNNLNELLELFDAYENLRRVKKFSNLISLIDQVRDSLWDSKNVSIEVLCHNPRACLRLGLETVAQCLLINPKTKEMLHKLFSYLSQDGSIYADNCKLPVTEAKTGDVPETTRSPTTLAEDMTSDLFTRKRFDATEASTAEPMTPKPTGRSAPTTDAEVSTSRPTTMTAEPKTELPRIFYTTPEYTTVESTPSLETKPTEYPTIASTVEEDVITMTTIRSGVTPNLMRGIVTETVPPKFTTEPPTTVMFDRTEELSTEKLTTARTPLVREVRITTEQTTVGLTEEEQTNMTEPVSTTEESTTKFPAVMIRGNLVSRLVTTDHAISTTDDDCYGDNCTSELPKKRIVMSNRAWLTNSTGPPFLLENLRIRESMDLPAVVTVTTTTPETPVVRNIVTDAPEASLESTTAIDEIPGLAKKPKSYSVSSSGEDCSGEGCTSSECSGEGCSSFSNTGKSVSIECNDRNGGCSPELSGDEKDCSSEGCMSTTVPSKKRTNCVGDNCLLQSTARSTPECVGDDCSEQSRSNESNCSGSECSDDNQRRPGTVELTNKIPYHTTSVPSWIRCDNKDPHHQRRLRRLRKVRIMNALHATVPIPTINPEIDSAGDISTESHSKYDHAFSTIQPSSSLIGFTTPKKPAQQGFHPQQNLQKKKISMRPDQPRPDQPRPDQPRPVPWFPLPKFVQTQEMENHKIPDRSDETYEEDDYDSEMEPNYDNTNMNINTNFINLRRYLAGNRRTESESLPPVLQVSPPNRGFQRVVAKVLKHPVPTRRVNEGPRREPGAILRGGIKPTEMNSESFGRRRVSLTRLNPALYQRRSKHEIGVVRKNKSVIKMPQKVSRPYFVL